MFKKWYNANKTRDTEIEIIQGSLYYKGSAKNKRTCQDSEF